MATNRSADAQPGLERVIEALVQRLGPDSVEQSLEKRTFFSTDLSRSGETALAVIAPHDVAALADAVRLCTDAGLAVIPRGGGFSYTGGYLPIGRASVVVDSRRLARIVEINAENMYVIVEAGVTWARLYDALKAQGLRTPYFGPMSGYGATVGGATSQGSFFLGSTQYGVVAESVLGLEVVLADGSLIRTGSWGAAAEVQPFLRHYGPDLTGMFLSDSGAFGLKTRIALKLIPFPAHQQYASFAFSGEADAVAALSEIGRLGVAAECYLWDPYFAGVMAAASTGLMEDLKFLGGVARGGGSLGKGLKNAARIALAGRGGLTGNTFVLNVTMDDFSSAGADGKLTIVRRVAARHHGETITATAPMAMRGTPFTNFNTTDRRTARRGLPMHGLTSHSRAVELGLRTRAAIDAHAEALAAADVLVGVIYFAVGQQMVACEAIPYWHDEEALGHDRVAEVSDLAALARFTERPAATRLAFDLRADLYAIYRDLGCAHMQIGKSYPWLESRSDGVRALASSFKAAVDPRGLGNPGSLGL